MFDDDKPKDLVTRIKYKYWEIWPHYLRPGTMWYNFKCWAWHRHSTVRARRLPHTWCDRRELLLYMSFEILCQFIEKECSPGHVQWFGDCPHTVMVDGVVENVMDEMLELKWWWEEVFNKEYPEMMDNFWAVAYECGPTMKCVAYDGMPEGIAGELVSEYEDDEQRDAYKLVIDQINKTEKLMDEKCEVMLKRLATVRLWMWT
jgi:hypothetical protein